MTFFANPEEYFGGTAAGRCNFVNKEARIIGTTQTPYLYVCESYRTHVVKYSGMRSMRSMQIMRGGGRCYAYK